MSAEFFRSSAKFNQLLHRIKNAKVIGCSSAAVIFAVGGSAAWLRWHSKDDNVPNTISYTDRPFYLKALLRLARSQDTDIRFFGLTKFTETEVLLEQELRTLVSCLPVTGASDYMEYLTSKALSTDKVADLKGVEWNYGRADFEYWEPFLPPQEFPVALYCMQALCQHSVIADRCVDIVRLGGLRVLLRAIQMMAEQTKVKRLVLRIVGNLAVVPSLHEDIVKAGWVDMLARELRSDDTVISLLAARALANLDTDSSDHEDGSVVYEDGVFIMHPVFRQKETIAADVVFVHGLLGGPFRTWRQDDRVKADPEYTSYTQCWPKDWLCSDCSNLRVISVQYDTQLSSWLHKYDRDPSGGSLGMRGNVLLEKLKKAGVGTRPIIWVGHSMGGLLIKQILRASLTDLAPQTRGIVFYSVPHHGSKVAQISTQISFLLYPSVEVQQLSQDSDYLKQLHTDFTQWVQDYQVPCVSFVESLKTLLKMKLKLLIVSRESAEAGVGELTVLDANHINICKPYNRHCPCYARTLAFIKQCVHPRTMQDVSDETSCEDCPDTWSPFDSMFVDT